jgi:hypothetical protein
MRIMSAAIVIALLSLANSPVQAMCYYKYNGNCVLGATMFGYDWTCHFDCQRVRINGKPATILKKHGRWVMAPRYMQP